MFHFMPYRSRLMVVKAQQGEGRERPEEPSSSSSSSEGMDWGKAWRGLKAGLRGTGSSNYVGGAADASPGAYRRPLDPVQAKLRADEGRLVDLWTQPWFFGLMAFATFGVLVAIINNIRIDPIS
jgi:hypothetical protein